MKTREAVQYGRVRVAPRDGRTPCLYSGSGVGPLVQGASLRNLRRCALAQPCVCRLTGNAFLLLGSPTSLHHGPAELVRLVDQGIFVWFRPESLDDVCWQHGLGSTLRGKGRLSCDDLLGNRNWYRNLISVECDEDGALTSRSTKEKEYTSEAQVRTSLVVATSGPLYWRNSGG